MSKESQKPDRQDAINQYTTELINSSAWKYFRSEALEECERLLSEIMTVASSDIKAQDNKLLYTMRDVQIIKYNLIKNFLNTPFLLLSVPHKNTEVAITEDDVYASGILDKFENELPSDSPY